MGRRANGHAEGGWKVRPTAAQGEQPPRLLSQAKGAALRKPNPLMSYQRIWESPVTGVCGDAQTKSGNALCQTPGRDQGRTVHAQALLWEFALCLATIFMSLVWIKFWTWKE